MKFLLLTAAIAASLLPAMAPAKADIYCYMQRADGTMIDLSSWCERGGTAITPPVVGATPQAQTQPASDKTSQYLKALANGQSRAVKDWVAQNPGNSIKAGRDYCSARSRGISRSEYQGLLANTLTGTEEHGQVLSLATRVAPIYLCPGVR